MIILHLNWGKFSLNWILHKNLFLFLDEVQKGLGISVGIFASPFLPECFLNATMLSWLEIFQMIFKGADNFSSTVNFGTSVVFFSSRVC